ncbi:hypothetical protein ATANTOWER_018353 [Ataeniobius toweri]|uniref:Uncharacterized protein n=1 Tax=Ataeniobius toweri TaxID=208326 RepID=A0ABU7C349_9TELE|nr:hypothetical protein [Ataeniobius toweri]
MAGLSVSKWTLSLLLLSFFMSFKQTSANPICTTNCSINEFQKNVNALGDLAEVRGHLEHCVSEICILTHSGQRIESTGLGFRYALHNMTDLPMGCSILAVTSDREN